MRTIQWMIKNKQIEEGKSIAGSKRNLFSLYDKFVPDTYDISYVDAYYRGGGDGKS